MRPPPRVPFVVALLGLCLPLAARASTGVCDQSSGNAGATEQACVAAIQALGPGTVVDGVFKDAQGRTGDQLPVYGKLINPFPGCTTGNTICNGDLTNYQGNPKVNCVNKDRTFSTIASFVDALDWKYANSIPPPRRPRDERRLSQLGGPGHRRQQGGLQALGGPGLRSSGDRPTRWCSSR